MITRDMLEFAGYHSPEWAIEVPLTEEQIAFGYQVGLEVDPAIAYPLYLAELRSVGALDEEVTQFALECARLCATNDLKYWYGPMCIRWLRRPALRLDKHEPGPNSVAAPSYSEAFRMLVSGRVGRPVLSAVDAWVPPADWRSQANGSG